MDPSQIAKMSTRYMEHMPPALPRSDVPECNSFCRVAVLNAWCLLKYVGQAAGSNSNHGTTGMATSHVRTEMRVREREPSESWTVDWLPPSAYGCPFPGTRGLLRGAERSCDTLPRGCMVRKVAG